MNQTTLHHRQKTYILVKDRIDLQLMHKVNAQFVYVYAYYPLINILSSIMLRLMYIKVAKNVALKQFSK